MTIPVSSNIHSFLAKIDEEKQQGYHIELVYGTSATPPQSGHTDYLEKAVAYIKPDHTRVVPNRVSPFKVNNQVYNINPEQKFEMTRLSFSDHPEFEIDRQEIDRVGASYTYMTIDTICEKMENKNISAKIYLLVTDESAEEFYAWGRVDQIVEKVTLVFGNRPGYVFNWEQLERRMKQIDKLAQDHQIKTVQRGDKEVKVIVINGQELEKVTIEGKEVPAGKIMRISEKVFKAVREGHMPFAGTISVSSSDVRELIAKEKPITGLVHPKVEEYLKETKLFQDRNQLME